MHMGALHKIYTQSYIIATIQAVPKISIAKCPFFYNVCTQFPIVFCSHLAQAIDS